MPLSIALDRADRLDLLLDIEIAVEHAHSAELRHDDRHVGLGDGVHRRGEHRDVEREAARHEGAGVGHARQDSDSPGYRRTSSKVRPRGISMGCAKS
jgi:hypothetical protein